MATIAKQERIRLIERSAAGQATARAKGVRFGRPKVVVDSLKAKEMRDSGVSVQEIAKKYETTIFTIYRRLKENAN